MDQELKDELKSADSIIGIINIMNQYYTLDKPLPGLIRKFVIASLEKLITKLQIKKRSLWQKS